MTIVYLTSTNPVKRKITNLLLTLNLNITAIKCIESDSGIEGGQPYGISETQQGCINRTKQFKNYENFISIENGFIKESNENWYDIAFIYIRLNNKEYSGWSSKRYFPSNLYNNTEELVKYFEIHSITRYKQLYDCLEDIIVNKIKNQ